MTQIVKPRIRRSFNYAWARYEWVCSDNSEVMAYAWGMTPEEAYERWLRWFRVYRSWA
jgi:hypothetical protein